MKLEVTSTGEIISGGPSGSQAQRAIESRIEQQSEGKIRLINFRPIKSKFANVELDDRTFCEMEFQADIEFSERCRWSVNYRGRPLTFKTFATSNSTVSGNSIHRQIEISEAGEKFTVNGAVWFNSITNSWAVAGFAAAGPPEQTVDVQSKKCINNLRQIGLAFRLWSGDHDDHYSFNVSTKIGGTLELCARGKDGFDENLAVHFKSLSNELGAPVMLICPLDSSKSTAANFAELQSANISYQLRTGTKIDETNPEEVLAVCPLHNHVLHADGSVKPGKQK